MADERGHMLEQVEQGASESEIRDRFAQQGYLVYSVKAEGLADGRVAVAAPPQESGRTSLSSSISSS